MDPIWRVIGMPELMCRRGGPAYRVAMIMMLRSVGCPGTGSVPGRNTLFPALAAWVIVGCAEVWIPLGLLGHR